MQQSSILVIGAGYSGLAAAALLAKQGYSVTVLEAHDTLGGCAGFYRRGAMTFDVGATTFSAVQPNQPAGQVFADLGITPVLEQQNPGQLIRIDGNTIVRHADRYAWIDTASATFGGNQRGFWQALYNIEDAVWNLVGSRTYLPPSTPSDWLAMCSPSNLRALRLLPGMVRSVRQLMHRYGVDNDPLFMRFVNEQLLISTQSTADNAPWLTGALGLTYPSETYYPIGGMYRPALQLMRSLTSNGGNVLFRRNVTSITSQKGALQVRCANGEVFTPRHVVNSMPIWNVARVAQGPIGQWAQKWSNTYPSAWSAITAYAAFEGTHSLPTAYVQHHLARPMQGVHSGSVFVTVKPNHDVQKAPSGVITVTLSTHALWQDLLNMQALTDSMKAALFEAVPELQEMPMVHFEVGTPQTWQRYTGRHHGYVGGLPHTIQRPFLAMPPNRTPVKGFWMIGDTAFPGQGTPAVMLGARNTALRIMAAEGHSPS